MRFDPHVRLAPPALRGDALALDRIRPDGWEIDVVEDPVIVVVPYAVAQEAAHGLGAVLCGRFKRIVQGVVFRPVKLAERNRGQTLKCRLHRCADGAGVEHILGGIVAPVHTRKHKIGRRILHHLVDGRQNAIGGRAFGGEATFAELRKHRGMRVTDAMPDARLLEGRRDSPDFTIVPGDLGRDVLHHLQARRVYSIVVRNEYPHAHAL